MDEKHWKKYLIRYKKGNPTIFVARDIAIALGYKKPNNAITRHIREDGRRFMYINDARNRKQPQVVINEDALFSFLKTTKSNRKYELEAWIIENILLEDDFIDDLFLKEINNISSKNKEIIKNTENIRDTRNIKEEPKDEIIYINNNNISNIKNDDILKDNVFYNDLLSVNYFSRQIKSKYSIDIGRNRMFKYLRNKGFLDENNIPYKEYLNNYFMVKKSQENNRCFLVTLLTPLGAKEIEREFLKDYEFKMFKENFKEQIKEEVKKELRQEVEREVKEKIKKDLTSKIKFI